MSDNFEVREATYNKEQLTQFAKEASQYLLSIFVEGDFNIPQFVGELAKNCMEHKEVLTCLQILRYCRETGYALPKHYNEIASNGDLFDFYCRQLLHAFIEMEADFAA